jgi:hypothetical protein
VQQPQVTVRPLDADLLQALESSLRAHGVPAVDYAQPGLSEHEMAERVKPLGISLPLEARLWWGWRDGVPFDAGTGPQEIGPGIKWFPLDEAVAECESTREMLAAIHGPDHEWSRHWLPLVNGDGRLYVTDTAVAEAEPCPVHVYWFDQGATPADLPSIGDLVVLWIEAIARGAWVYDRGADHWTVDQSVLYPWPAAHRSIV